MELNWVYLKWAVPGVICHSVIQFKEEVIVNSLWFIRKNLQKIPPTGFLLFKYYAIKQLLKVFNFFKCIFKWMSGVKFPCLRIGCRISALNPRHKNKMWNLCRHKKLKVLLAFNFLAWINLKIKLRFPLFFSGECSCPLSQHWLQ